MFKTEKKFVHSIILNVTLFIVPTYISAQPLNFLELISSSALFLNCSAVGNPLPTINWIRTFSNGSETVFPIFTTGRIVTLSQPSATVVESFFVITMALFQDTANYRCLATNSLRSETSSSSSVAIYRELMLK